MNKCNLIIVDCQYDFVEGTLRVPAAKEAVDNITKFIVSNRDKISQIVFTLDWHPVNHCSFKGCGGKWSPHCIQYTKGASIDNNLFEAVYHSGIEYDTVLKGECASVEEYSAFQSNSSECILYGSTQVILLENAADIVVCGIAGDYCVKETLNSIKHLNPKVYMDGVASIDDGSIIKEFISNLNLETV